jgi:hypothetical protein
MSDSISPTTEPNGLRKQLNDLRDTVQALHKTLLDSERLSYEASFGRPISGYDFLHLLTSDPWFAWLAPITHLFAEMDTLLDAKEPLTAASVDALIQRTKTLLTPAETGEGFARQYDEVLQRDPDVLFAHVTLMKFFRAQAAPGKTNPTSAGNA